MGVSFIWIKIHQILTFSRKLPSTHMTAIRNLNAPPLFVAFDTPVADKGVSMIAPDRKSVV